MDKNQNAAALNSGAADPGAMELEKYRPYLMRYALAQLRDTTMAEDAVQDTFLAVLQKADSFVGRSTRKTWLVGILKHKIIDRLRRIGRDQGRPAAANLDAAFDDDDENLSGTLFTDAGRWVEMPASWGTPEQLLRSKQFMQVFDQCRRVMPAHQAQVFSMREALELTVEEICKILAITPTNCHSTLFKARARLRECLGRRWLGNTGDTKA